MVVAYQREDAPSSCVGKKKHSWKVGDHMPPLGVLVAIFIFVGRRLSLISEGVMCRVDAAGWPHLPGSSVACLFFAKQA